ncbi:MAG TPA: hypothetical protein VME41_15165 [Stellaceae bacterium]|nr:hypothetical protein [Stellaceae bacterium]
MRAHLSEQAILPAFAGDLPVAAAAAGRPAAGFGRVQRVLTIRKDCRNELRELRTVR